jgi:hypothetical protein
MSMRAACLVNVIAQQHHQHNSVAFEDQLFEAMLWSDPRPIQGRQLSARGAGVEFGQVCVSPCSTD